MSYTLPLVGLEVTWLQSANKLFDILTLIKEENQPMSAVQHNVLNTLQSR